MAKRSKKKTYAELLKISEEAVSRKNAEYSFDPSMIKQDLKDRIEDAIQEDLAKVDAMPKDQLEHNSDMGFNFAGRALIAGLSAAIGSLGITVTHGADAADITFGQDPTGLVDLDALYNLIKESCGDEEPQAYLKRLIDEDNARKSQPKAEEVKPAIRQLDLED